MEDAPEKIIAFSIFCLVVMAVLGGNLFLYEYFNREDKLTYEIVEIEGGVKCIISSNGAGVTSSCWKISKTYLSI